MKRFLFLLTVCTVALCASASNRYVTPTGNGTKDGKSWENAAEGISSMIWKVVAPGDTMFIAEGTYNEGIALSSQNGTTYLGGYNAETGERDIELYETILDGTGLSGYFIVKYDDPPTDPMTIDGFTIQNVQHGEWDAGAVFLRGNMTLSNCIIRDCETTGNSYTAGVWIQTKFENGSSATPGTVRNCIFENCVRKDKTSGAGAVYNHDGGIIENCIIRGCQGGIGGIYNAEGGIVRNCVLYNNLSDYNACLNGKGTYINNTICNNLGASGRYGGCRIEGKVVNCVLWGNQVPGTASATNQNYIASGTGSSNNIADIGTGMTTGLGSGNSDADGPNFLTPTNFIGLPSNDLEREAMRNADFSLTEASVSLVDQGTSEGAPEKDITGADRAGKGSGIDIGAYEYDPNAVKIDVTGVNIIQDTLKVIVGESGSLIFEVLPANASNKRVSWSIDDETIATIKNGKVTGLKVDTTTAHVTTQDGGFTDYAIVVVKPVPPKFYPHEVLEADANYSIENYTIPSFIRFLVAKEEARIDSFETKDNPELAHLQLELDTMNMMIAELQAKEEPYNQIATINGDPHTHMGFCWFTNGGITDGVVQLLPMANATAEDFASVDGVITVSANTSDANLHYTPIQASESPKYDICTAAGLPRTTKFDYVSHKALATELTPGTTYSWRVGFDGHWSEIGQFVTQDENQGDFSFVYMTDSHIQDAEYIEQARQCAEALVKNETDVKFCLFPGDFVDTGGKTNSEWQWERWFEGSMRPMLNKMAVVPTDGNHDDSPSLNYDYHFNTDWGFANGASVKPQFKGITYSFQYGDVLFLVFSMQDWWRESGTHENEMHSTYFTTDIRNWFLEQIEAHPTAKYRVTLSHKNVFSGAGHHLDDECTLIRTLMTPIFKECKIDLAIQGHDHCYEVMGPVDPDTWTVVPGSVKDTVRVAPEETDRWANGRNKNGLEGGTFTTDDGTLYFIGATCGRKRYEPYPRNVMDTAYTTDPAKLYDGKHHNVKNLFDLYTTKYGQPFVPSYSRFNVTSEGIEVITYGTDAAGNKTVFNTIRVKHAPVATGIDETAVENKVSNGEKFIKDGQLYIRKDGRIYNVIGQEMAQ